MGIIDDYYGGYDNLWSYTDRHTGEIDYDAAYEGANWSDCDEWGFGYNSSIGESEEEEMKAEEEIFDTEHWWRACGYSSAAEAARAALRAAAGNNLRAVGPENHAAWGSAADSHRAAQDAVGGSRARPVYEVWSMPIETARRLGEVFVVTNRPAVDEAVEALNCASDRYGMHVSWPRVYGLQGGSANHSATLWLRSPIDVGLAYFETMSRLGAIPPPAALARGHGAGALGTQGAAQGPARGSHGGGVSGGADAVGTQGAAQGPNPGAHGGGASGGRSGASGGSDADACFDAAIAGGSSGAAGQRAGVPDGHSPQEQELDQTQQVQGQPPQGQEQPLKKQEQAPQEHEQDIQEQQQPSQEQQQRQQQQGQQPPPQHMQGQQQQQQEPEQQQEDGGAQRRQQKIQGLHTLVQAAVEDRHDFFSALLLWHTLGTTGIKPWDEGLAELKRDPSQLQEPSAPAPPPGQARGKKNKKNKNRNRKKRKGY